jgi:hypothetical protein
LLCSLGACDPVDDSELQLGAGLRDASDLGGFSDKEADFVQSLFKSYEGAPGWPAMPRRTACITESLSNEASFKLGLKPNVLGAEAGATTSVTFGLSYYSTLLLLRTAVPGDDRFIVTKDGQDVLNVKPGVDFVGLCSYAASVKVGTRFLGEISIFGTGVSDQTDLQKNVEVNQGSNFFEVREGDTVPALQELCLTTFRDEVRDSVIEDLKSLVKASVTYDGPKQSDLKRALQAALFGPKTWGLSIFGHDWNVEQALTRTEKGTFFVEGAFDRVLPWYLVKWPIRVTYSVSFRDGKRQAANVSVPEEEGWKGAAHDLAALIADEVQLEHGTSLAGK